MISRARLKCQPDFCSTSRLSLFFMKRCIVKKSIGNYRTAVSSFAEAKNANIKPTAFQSKDLLFLRIL